MPSMLRSVKDDYSRMVVGFVFDDSLRNVLLVHKKAPSWQRGFLNGIGGKCKEGEPFEEAIVRETFEESDLQIVPHQWTHFLKLFTGGKPGTAPQVEVAFFFAAVEHCVITSARKKTDEELIIIPRRSLHDYQTVPNLQWIIPLAANWNEGLLPYRYRGAIEVFEEPKRS